MKPSQRTQSWSDICHKHLGSFSWMTNYPPMSQHLGKRATWPLAIYWCFLPKYTCFYTTRYRSSQQARCHKKILQIFYNISIVQKELWWLKGKKNKLTARRSPVKTLDPGLGKWENSTLLCLIKERPLTSVAPAELLSGQQGMLKLYKEASGYNFVNVKTEYSKYILNIAK